MMSAMFKPVTFMSGGLVGDICPKVLTQDQLNRLNDPNSNASPAEKAAEAIKADEAGAAARKAAVRDLGTVDCHYYPEAEGGLLAALRQDRNECVRLEAALALGKGCCCTPKTVKALTIAANGSDEDKNPAETSERVKFAAMVALGRCMAHVQEKAPEPAVPPERPPEAPEPPMAGAAAGDVQLAAHQARLLQGRAQGQFVVNAGRLLAEQAGAPAAGGQSAQGRTPPTGQRNLIGLIVRAFSPLQAAEQIPFAEAALMSAPPEAPAP
jgi:hypothetical protein